MKMGRQRKLLSTSETGIRGRVYTFGKRAASAPLDDIYLHCHNVTRLRGKGITKECDGCNDEIITAASAMRKE